MSKEGKNSTETGTENGTKKSISKARRTVRLPQIRLTQEEKKALLEEFGASPYPSQSAFIRAKLLDRRYSDYQKMQFAAEIAAGALAGELQKTGEELQKIYGLLNDLRNKTEALSTNLTQNTTHQQDDLASLNPDLYQDLYQSLFETTRILLDVQEKLSR